MGHRVGLRGPAWWITKEHQRMRQGHKNGLLTRTLNKFQTRSTCQFDGSPPCTHKTIRNGGKSVPFMRPAIPHQPWIAMLTCMLYVHMSVYASLCICACMAQCLHASMINHPCMYLCPSVWLYVYLPVCLSACLSVSFAKPCVCMHVSMHAGRYVGMYVCGNVGV